MAQLNPFMVIVAVFSLVLVFGIFRRHFGMDTLGLAVQFGAIHLVSATIVAFVSGEDLVATLTFSYPSHNAVLAGPIAIGYAALLWGLICASVVIVKRLRGTPEELPHPSASANTQLQPLPPAIHHDKDETAA
jgi:hypothetical protein